VDPVPENSIEIKRKYNAISSADEKHVSRST
jgi:hypothetical protein